MKPVRAAGILLAGFLFLPSAWARPGSDDEAYLKAAPLIVSAKVTKIYDSRANTFSDPPFLRLAVERVLKGRLRSKEVDAVWSAPVPLEDQGVSLREWFERRGKEAYPPPEEGSRWILILVGPGAAGRYYVDTRCRYLFDEEIIDWLAGRIPEFRRSGKEISQ